MKVNKELLKGSTVVLVLSLLERQPMYGYEMIKELEERSQGIFAFKEGTLYPILHRLEQQGLLHSYWVDAETGRQRKYYEITQPGSDYLQSRKQEWKHFRSAVDRVIKLGEVGV